MSAPNATTQAFAAALLFCVSLALPAQAQRAGSPGAAEGAPRVEVEQSGELTRLFVVEAGREEARKLLRETSAELAVEKSGIDPAGRAAFVAWNEGDERWFALERRGEWAEARRLDDTLRLRAGHARLDERLPAVTPALAMPASGKLFVVQLRTISTPEWRAALEELGAETLAFLPHAAHVVRMPPSLVAAVAELDFVARVAPYQPGYRASDELLAWLEGAGGDAERVRRVRVMAFEWGAEAKGRIAEAARGLGAGVAEFWPSGQVLELYVERAQLRALLAHDDVEWVDAWTPRETDMDLVREDAGTNWVENNLGYCGAGVRAEVLDSGFQVDHPDFDGILTHKNVSEASHGTSTYGIIFGNGDRDGDGEAKGLGHLACAEQGIAADYDELGDRFLHTEELLSDPYFASFQSNSWGNARTRAYTSISAEMDDIIWRLDFSILQSQSNAGNQDSRPQAWAKNIISVGGIRHYDTLDTSDDAWASGASIGPAEDGRIKPDLNYWYDNIYTTTTGSGYTSTFGGTSGATPEAAGVLGLILEMWSDNVWGTDPEGATVFERKPSASTLKALLINNSIQYPFSGQADDLTRVHQGWGRPNAQVAHERADTSFIIDEEVNLLLDDVVSYDLDVGSGESELKVTMIYPDPPGPTAATLHRVNDVDLRVISPSGTVYHGNVGLLDAPYSSPGGDPNSVDTVENVFVENPEAGTWKVEVEAREINEDAVLDTPEDDVTFALVVTGGFGQLCDPPSVDFTVGPIPARVGEPVNYDATASGGAGAPFEYRWDFENDGRPDSTEEDPTHVFNRPYEGVTKLRVRDAAECPARTEKPVTITGPDLRYEDYVELTEISGNANGAVDPGETWELRARLRNSGNESGVGVSARLVEAPSAGSITVLQDATAFPDVPVGELTTADTRFRFSVGNDFPCGNDAVFDLVEITTTDPENVYPEELGVVRVLVGGSGPPSEFWSDGFESNNGWGTAGSGEWQRGAPQGLGGGSSLPGYEPNNDPTNAYEGSAVIGNDLTGLGQLPGSYENDINSTYTSPPIDASDSVETTMRFWKWLNIAPNDLAFVEVSDGSGTWERIFETNEDLDAAWAPVDADVSTWADRNPNFRVRFGVSADSVGTASGWNVDALSLSGVTSSSCEPFSSGLVGGSAGLSVEKGAPGELLLSWSADCGAGSAYGVYRGDLQVGYDSLAPEPGLCAVADTTATLPEGSGAADFFLVVPNDGAFDGGYGQDASRAPRAAPTSSCFPQDAVDACAYP